MSGSDGLDLDQVDFNDSFNNESDFDGLDLDQVDFNDSFNNESDLDGLDLDQINFDGSYNVESNSESESVPRVETDLDADFGLMDEIDFATDSQLIKAKPDNTTQYHSIS